MDGYIAVSCSHCNQPIYLARYKLELSAWACPACGAANESADARHPVFTPANRTPSRFGRSAQAS